mmetsp:Transcript_7265/g.10392  ORF Transcript_7265/g.10392 Transcript_7265/m.10392 type:complete len:117 (-) Transcript_7265:968-1318(-)
MIDPYIFYKCVSCVMYLCSLVSRLGFGPALHPIFFLDGLRGLIFQEIRSILVVAETTAQFGGEGTTPTTGKPSFAMVIYAGIEETLEWGHNSCSEEDAVSVPSRSSSDVKGKQETG